jgi:hypothetical protein
MIHMILNLVLIKSEDMPDHVRKERNMTYTRENIRAILEGANTRIPRHNKIRANEFF